MKMTPEAVAKRYRTKACASCGDLIKVYATQIRCRPCQQKDLKARQCPTKIAANRAVIAAIKTGQLVKQPCQACTEGQRQEKDRIHAHHEDYSQPLNVIWLCSAHHVWRHQEIAAGAKPWVSRFFKNPNEA